MLARSRNTQPISRGGRGAALEDAMEKAGGKTEDGERKELTAWRILQDLRQDVWRFWFVTKLSSG